MIKLLIVFALFFIGCAPSLIVKNKKYYKANYSTKTMVLWPFSSRDFSIDNADDVVDDFGKTDKRDPRDIVRDSCFSVMQEKLMKKETSISMIKMNPAAAPAPGSNSYLAIITVVGKDSIALPFSVPKRESLQLKPDIILIINKISFTRYNGSAGGPYGGASFPSLNSTLNYLVWSYNDSDAISYGQINVETPFLFAMTHSTWTAHFANMVYSALLNTPFPMKIEN